MGKTTAAAAEAIARAVRGGERLVWWVAPYYEVSLRGMEAVLQLLRPALGLWGIKVNRSRMSITIRTSNGVGTIEFKSANNPDALLGAGIDFLVFDEPSRIPASKVDYVWWQNLYPTLTDRKGECLFIGTPKAEREGMKNLLDVVEQRYLDGDPLWSCIRLTSYERDDEEFHKEIENARRQLPELIFRQEFLAERINLGGLYFQVANLKEYTEPPRGIAVFQGVDLAISQRTTADFFVIATVGYNNETGDVYILDIYRDRLTFNKQAEMIIEYARKWKPSGIVIETTAYQEAMAQYLLSFTTLPIIEYNPIRDKITRATPFMAAVENGKVYIPKQANWRHLFVSELIDFPSGEHDDQIDAVSSVFGAVITERATQRYEFYTGGNSLRRELVGRSIKEGWV